LSWVSPASNVKLAQINMFSSSYTACMVALGPSPAK
jgi:hypothetical protein